MLLFQKEIPHLFSINEILESPPRIQKLLQEKAKNFLKVFVLSPNSEKGLNQIF